MNQIQDEATSKLADQKGSQQIAAAKGQPPVHPPMVPYSALFRYATKMDKTMMYIGGFAAFANGAAFPSFSLIFGGMTDSFSKDGDDMVTQAGWNALWFIIVAIGTFIMSFIMFSTWIITGERQGVAFRKHYFAAILKQEIGWFDTINPNELSSRVANETHAIQGAIGEKMPTFIMTFSMTFFGFLIGYIKGWQLAAVITATLPALSIFMGIMAFFVQNSDQATQAAYSDAGAMAEQAINSIKTVKMLDGEDFECANYVRCLQKAASVTIKQSLGVGIALGMVWASLLWSYALGFWYGAKLIGDQTINDNTGEVYTAGDVMIIFFSVITGGFSLGQAGPCIQNFAKGQTAAYQMFQVMDRSPKIFDNPQPKSIRNFTGEIQLENVTFYYPNRPDQKVLNNLSLSIPAGKKIALVGESGCGKSTVLQLVERFYDCNEGQVLFGQGQDGFNIKDVNLVELRSHIGMVGQEPVLFATSIRENLLYGNPNASVEEMIAALTRVNAWDFISKMEKGLETYVGIGGSQLSGGQKQRIAIARAILKKPQILLLDEATSALDRTNEKLIQETLDEVSKGITTIVIAHRLSTVQNADLIYVIDKGAVVEQGTHNELIARHGKYEQLAKNQVIQEAEVQNEPELIASEKKSETPFEQLTMNNPVQIARREIEIMQQLKLKELVKKDDSPKVHALHDESVMLAEKQKLPATVKQAPHVEPEVQMGRLFAYNKEERVQFMLGIVAAVGSGCTFPIFSLFLSRMIAILVQSNPKFFRDFERDQKMREVREESDEIALIFFLIGICTFIIWTIQLYTLSYVGEKLTLKIRSDTYRKLLRMPLSYFDEPKNNAGTLTSRLSVDCKVINGLTSNILGINIGNIGSLICGVVIAFYYSWALTLVIFGITPIMFIGGTLQAKFLQGFSSTTDEAYKDSGNLIMEAVTNIRTVYSFGNQDIILNIYSKKVQEPLDQSAKNGKYAGLAFGFAQMQNFLVNALVFYVGAILVRDEGLEVESMFKAIFGLTFAVIGAGNNAAFAGDVGAAKNASKNIFEILDSEDEFQREGRLNKPKIMNSLIGNIKFENIRFKYANRDKLVFHDLSLSIQPGQKVAFVGPSGCGKSTLMQMLMRFYEPEAGRILLDGVDITDYDIRFLRRQFGIVSQEPVLFNGTIKENIQYNLRGASMEQIVEAAKQANAYDFIIKNQFEETVVEQKGNEQQRGQQFERQVGAKGTQISGGQKQRIAIARAILRNCNLLLLDEATSALDAQSEVLVQQSLNNLMQNKTAITIAHRFSTIKNSDMIYVFEEGKIVEQGTYEQLVQQRGAFYKMEQGIAN